MLNVESAILYSVFHQLLTIQGVTLVTLGGGEYLSRVDSWGELTHCTT